MFARASQSLGLSYQKPHERTDLKMRYTYFIDTYQATRQHGNVKHVSVIDLPDSPEESEGIRSRAWYA